MPCKIIGPFGILAACVLSPYLWKKFMLMLHEMCNFYHVYENEKDMFLLHVDWRLKNSFGKTKLTNCITIILIWCYFLNSATVWNGGYSLCLSRQKTSWPCEKNIPLNEMLSDFLIIQKLFVVIDNWMLLKQTVSPLWLFSAYFLQKFSYYNFVLLIQRKEWEDMCLTEVTIFDKEKEKKLMGIGRRLLCIHF